MHNHSTLLKWQDLLVLVSALKNIQWLLGSAMLAEWDSGMVSTIYLFFKIIFFSKLSYSKFSDIC
jgi:hypothetical protein